MTILRSWRRIAQSEEQIYGFGLPTAWTAAGSDRRTALSRTPVSHEELQQRICFADAHFTNHATPGSRTDRGRVYIALGPPDQVEDHPHDPVKDASFPWQEWIYWKFSTDI
jgi:GWxTD domain-containing protein